MSVRFLNKNLISIDKWEALRYMGYKSSCLDEETDKITEESIRELKEIAQPKYVYRIFNLKKEKNNISFEGQIEIKSDDLEKLFINCDKSAVLAATIGFEAEKRIKYYSMTDLSKALAFDACAAACIESLCNYAESEIKDLAAKEACSITFRYSPGYGDLPISHQAEILAALNAPKLIGLTALESSILVPRKSVTAFIGFDKANKNEIHEKSCSNCSRFGNCAFSKEGVKGC